MGHKHVLASQRELIEATEKYVASVGGFGSGKSLAAAVLCHLLSVTVPGNRGIVIRRTYPKLHDTAQRVFLEVLGRAGVEYEGRERRDSWPHWILYPNGSEVFFRESKDLGRFLGPEYGFFWIDEAIEEPEKTFTDLMGRLRLPLAWDYLRGILTTNPPPFNHWITKKFGAKPGLILKTTTDEFTGKPLITRFRRIGSTSMDNPALPESYVADLKATLTPGEVKRVLKGETGFAYEGKPVYAPPFDASVHVGMWEPQRHPADHLIRPMTRGWDFGFHAPAVLWTQLFKCWETSTHFFVIDEYTPQNIEAEDLARVVVARSAERYGACREWTDIGDTAGAAISDRGPGPIVRLAQPRPRGFGLVFRHKKFPSVDPGIALLRSVMGAGAEGKQPRQCRCGLPIFMVHARCTVTIDALAGGYHYPMPKYGKEESLKPVKDGMYDNPMDALRYVAELGYRVAAVDAMMLDRLTRANTTRPQEAWQLPTVGDPMVRL